MFLVQPPVAVRPEFSALSNCSSLYLHLYAWQVSRMELKGVREALTRADQMEHGICPTSPHGVRPASPHGVRPASAHWVCPSSLSPNVTLAAAITSLQQQQVRQEQQQHYHTPHLSLRLTGVTSADVAAQRSTGIASSDVAIRTSGSNVDMLLSRNVVEMEGGEEVQQCLIEMLQGRHPLQLQVITTRA